MSTETLLLLAAAFFCVATLYSSIGHAGASGYLATMALVGVAPDSMRPIALALNILVACFTVARFAQAGYFSWRGLWPFLLGSVPLAAVGGAWQLATHVYYVVAGVALLLSAFVLLWRVFFHEVPQDATAAIPVAPAVMIGAAIGLLSGLTGTGGGIFLSPVIVLAGWAGPKHTAGISAPFILVNSSVALVAGSVTWASIPPETGWLALAVLAGAGLGTWIGIRHLSMRSLLVALAMVLALAAAKLFLTR